MRRTAVLLALAGVFLIGCAKPPCVRCIPQDCPVRACPHPPK